MNQNKKIDEIRKIFKKNGYVLITKKYEGCKQKFECICPNGHKQHRSKQSIKEGRGCKVCMGKERYSFEYVKRFFENKNCKLLSTEYRNNNQLLEYICACGEKSEIRFRSFQGGGRCKKCQSERAIETNKNNHNGKHHFQTESFKKKRGKKNLEKYGVEHVLQNEEIKEKMKKTNLKRYGTEFVFQNENVKEKIKKTNLEKYGVEYNLQNDKIYEKFQNTLMERYGVPSLAYLSTPASKESQVLFFEIQNKMIESKIDISKNYFASLNQEFVIKYLSNYYKYDFVNTKLKKCIEYNGKNFHPHPSQKEDETGWCAFHPHKTVKEARRYEEKKLEGIRKRGFEILVVWDYELHQDFEALVEKCLTFIKEK